jgi:hypothetical protein
MCEAISATTMMYLSLASTAVSLYAQNETAKAQKASIRNQQEHEREEVHEAAEEELGQRIREQREARARARVAAGESGALGASFAAQINQSLSDSNMDAALIQKNAAFAQRGVDDRANTALAGIRSPSALEAGLSIATAGIQGYKTGLSLQDRTTPAAKGISDAAATGGMSPVPQTNSGLTIFGDPNP